MNARDLQTQHSNAEDQGNLEISKRKMTHDLQVNATKINN